MGSVNSTEDDWLGECDEATCTKYDVAVGAYRTVEQLPISEQDLPSCPIGQFINASTVLCQPCPAGTFSQSEHSFECTSCDKVGGYQPEEGQGSCLACPSGTGRRLGSDPTKVRRAHTGFICEPLERTQLFVCFQRGVNELGKTLPRVA